jgi:REP element-mobilizing transposase RayT
MDYKQEYHRNLPHIRPGNSAFFLTDRLIETLPKEAIQRLQQLKEGYEKAKDPKTSSRLFKYLDERLDAGFGPTWLSDPRVASIVMQEFHKLPENASLHAFCIMPNHTHSLISLNDDAQDLTEILRLLKGRTARWSNQALGRSGPFWQRETYDHKLRAGEWERIIYYIAENPVKAGLVEHWSDWPFTYIAEEIRYLLSEKGLPAKASATF